MADTIKVRAAAGREVPLHRTVLAAPGGGHSVLRPEDGVVELPDSADVRRKLRSGDLELAADAAPAPTKVGGKKE